MEYFSHFNKLSFWRDYYQSKDISEHDWLQSYNQLQDIFRIACQGKDNVENQIILDIGCGTSTVLESLYKKGFNNLVGIDYCKSVIDFMNEKYKQQKENFAFYEMNALKTDFENDQFDIIFDKEVNRILKNGGKYILVSHGNINFREKYFNELKDYSKTTPIEEMKLIRTQLLDNKNNNLEGQVFHKILQENISVINTEHIEQKNFHYGIIFEKNLLDINETHDTLNENKSVQDEERSEKQLTSNQNQCFLQQQQKELNEIEILTSRQKFAINYLSKKFSILDKQTKTKCSFAYQEQIKENNQIEKQRSKFKGSQKQKFIRQKF